MSAPQQPRVRSARYGRIAGVYNFVARVVHGDVGTRAQRSLLSLVDAECRVLNVGCGPLPFNEELAGAAREATFVDIAPEMVAITERLVRRRFPDGPHRFVSSDVMDLPDEPTYDRVFACFMLQTFDWDDARRVLARLAGLVAPGGLLCIADEIATDRPWARPFQAVGRWVEHGLHHLVVDHPMHPIHDLGAALTELGWSPVHQRRLFGGSILAAAYQKREAARPGGGKEPTDGPANEGSNGAEFRGSR
ncbi:MAG: class I SAM-dependent methyltransferase [Planctomycetota bacterium]